MKEQLKLRDFILAKDIYSVCKLFKKDNTIMSCLDDENMAAIHWAIFSEYI